MIYEGSLMDIKSLIENRNYKISQGLFDRERKCFLIKIFDGSVKEWSTDSISFWLMSLDKEIIEFSKDLIEYKKIDDFSVVSIQKITSLKIPNNSRFDRSYIVSLIIDALKEYKEVGVSYAHKIKNYDLTVDASEVL